MGGKYIGSLVGYINRLAKEEKAKAPDGAKLDVRPTQ
jgi:hypothetical protein